MLTVKQQQSILVRSSTHDLESKLGRLNSAYFLIDDRQQRQEMLLLIDEIKLELKKRGNYD
jgi:hypothetical protein